MPLEVRWPFPDLSKSHRWWKIRSACVIPLVGGISKLWIGCLNNVRIYNMEPLINAIENRPKGKPLVTICNHHSCFDDPGLWGLLHWRILFRNHIMRWSGAASDIIFLNNFLATFFALGNTVPIARGDGVYHRSIDFLVDRLNEGKWVHFFPEGKVNLITKDFLRFKWGIGRMIADSKKTPIIIPFWHIGMDEVLPNKSPYIPRFGKNVTVLYGNPIDLRDVLNSWENTKQKAVVKRKIITDYLQYKMQLLKDEAEALHAERLSQKQL